MDECAFPRIERAITRGMVKRYGEINGDRNMIHYDDQAARAAGFPRAVAHGAITAAVLSEACRGRFGAAWIGQGRLEVKFVAPFLVGDTLTTHGRRTAAEPADGRETWEVWCENGAGERVLAGVARGVFTG